MGLIFSYQDTVLNGSLFGPDNAILSDDTAQSTQGTFSSWLLTTSEAEADAQKHLKWMTKLKETTASINNKHKPVGVFHYTKLSHANSGWIFWKKQQHKVTDLRQTYLSAGNDSGQGTMHHCHLQGLHPNGQERAPFCRSDQQAPSWTRPCLEELGRYWNITTLFSLILCVLPSGFIKEFCSTQTLLQNTSITQHLCKTVDYLKYNDSYNLDTIACLLRIFPIFYFIFSELHSMFSWLPR